MLYALVLAGGSGTRLWPNSRSNYPKQFLHLGSRQTMLQDTIARTVPIIPLDRICIATGIGYASLVTKQVADLPQENLVIEPVGRGTAACIGLAALQIQRRDPEAIMVVLSADHRIANIDCYHDALILGASLAAQGLVVTFGLEPTVPHPGYGYIEVGESLALDNTVAAYKVARFDEKPDIIRAQAYVASGRHFWNAGMFVWRADRILQELGKYQPELLQHLVRIDIDIHENGDGLSQAVVDTWLMIENISIDVAVMQQTDAAVVIPADLGRQDVGDWNAIYEAQQHDQDGNAVVGQHIGIATKRSLIFGAERVIATVGIEDYVVIDADDAVLICPRARVQDVKKLVTQLHHQHNHMV